MQKSNLHRQLIAASIAIREGREEELRVFTSHFNQNGIQEEVLIFSFYRMNFYKNPIFCILFY